MLDAEKANDAIFRLEKAITQISSVRSKLGATQNRLEHTINNLQVTSENLTSAESRIRDTDMAQEMTEFTKNNILKPICTIDAFSSKPITARNTTIITRLT